MEVAANDIIIAGLQPADGSEEPRERKQSAKNEEKQSLASLFRQSKATQERGRNFTICHVGGLIDPGCQEATGNVPVPLDTQNAPLSRIALAK